MKQIKASIGFLQSHQIYHDRYVKHNEDVHYLIFEFANVSSHIGRQFSDMIRQVV